MCVTCEHMLYEEHRNATAEPFDPCPQCGKFQSNEGRPCYHCFAVGNTIDENGNGWLTEDIVDPENTISLFVNFGGDRVRLATVPGNE